MHYIILAKLETKSDTLYPPFGILYVANALESAGYKVTIFHGVGNKKNIQKLLAMIAENDPLFIGFSTMTGPQLIPTIKASELIKREVPHLLIVWGGIHPTVLPRQCLSEDFVDMVVIGDGEGIIVELTDALRNKRNLDQIKGLGYKEKGNIRINEMRNFVDLDYHCPSWHLVNLNRYFKKKWGFKRVLPILISRGCPHRCNFCYNIIVNRKIWRSPSLEEAVREIGRLKRNYAIDGVMFYDDSFFTNTNRALEIIKQMDLPWFGEIRADYIDEFLIKEIVRYNCQTLYVGAESGSQRVLDLIQKDIKVEDIVRCVRLCKKYNLELNLSFMSGIPGESMEDTQKTVDFIDYLNKVYPKINIEFKIYTPYPGTPLWERALEYGLREPRRTVDWASYQRGICNLPWIQNPGKLEIMYYACNSTYNRAELPKVFQLKNILKAILIYIEKIRWKNKFFKFPIELRLLSFIKSMSGYGT